MNKLKKDLLTLFLTLVLIMSVTVSANLLLRSFDMDTLFYNWLIMGINVFIFWFIVIFLCKINVREVINTLSKKENTHPSESNHEADNQ